MVINEMCFKEIHLRTWAHTDRLSFNINCDFGKGTYSLTVSDFPKVT